MAQAKKTFSQYIEETQRLALKVAAVTNQIDEERLIPREITNELADKGFFRLLLPKSLGGAELDHPSFLRIVYEFAKVDASTGWCINQNNVFSTNSTRVPENTARKIWSDWRNIVTNGPPTKESRAIAVDGGYRLTGRWNFSSGIRHATWVAALTPMPSEQSKSTLVMLIPKKDITMIDTWDVHGLRGTGSFGFEANDIFVPNDHTYSPTDVPRESGPLYAIPTTMFFCSGFATVALGAARTGLDATIALALEKTPNPGDVKMLEITSVQRQIGQAEAIWRSAKTYVNENASNLWESVCANETINTEDRIAVRLASTHGIRMAAEVIDICYNLGGSSAIFGSNAIQRRFRDIHVITQQVQGQMYHYDTAGQFFLGLHPQGSF